MKIWWNRFQCCVLMPGSHRRCKGISRFRQVIAEIHWNPTPPAMCKTPEMVAINHQPQLTSRILRVNYILFWGDFFDGSKLGYQFAIAKLCPDLSIFSDKTWYILLGPTGDAMGSHLAISHFFFGRRRCQPKCWDRFDQGAGLERKC